MISADEDAIADRHAPARARSGVAGGLRAPQFRQFRAISGLFGVLLAVFVVWKALELVSTRVTDGIDDIGELLAATTAGVACLLAARRSDPALRRTWRWMGASALAWAVGEAVWTWYDLVRGVTVPFPSVADVGFLLAVPLAITALLLYPSAPGRGVTRGRSLLDGVIIGGSLLFVSWTTALGNAYQTGPGITFAQVIGLAYLISGVVIVTVALSVLPRSASRLRPPLALIVCGMLWLTIADSSFSYLTQISSFGDGNVTDAGWVAGYLLIALAALWPIGPATGAADERPPTALWQVVLPYLFLGAAFVAAIWKRVSSGPLDGFLLAVGATLVTAVLFRQILTIVENRRLTGELELAVATLRANEAELTHHALHDPLTALPNRVLFGDRLDQALARRRRNSRVVAVLLCDLDSFKDVNDTLGHSAGDEVLVTAAGRLASCVRPTDTVARIGGDEFAIIIDNAESASAIAKVAQRVCEEMRPLFNVSGRDFAVRVSIGVALAHAGGDQGDSLLRDADVALYAAKAGGGDNFTFFEPQLGEAYIDRLGLQAELADALGNGELFLEYQPILELSSGTLVGVEALLRWRHPRRGVLAPGEFLPVAESSGAIVPIGAWVLGEAARQLKRWSDTSPGGAALWIAVNVSARQLASGDLFAAVGHAVGSAGIAPERLHIELTESALIDHADGSLQLLADLKELGVRLDIDDFGTGYSSLTYLKRLPIDAVKIDRVFVEGLKVTGRGLQGRDAVIVEAIISLAHALGLGVIAEGVETRSQLEKLRVLGCDLGQGYFFSRPVAPAGLDNWVLTAGSAAGAEDDAVPEDAAAPEESAGTATASAPDKDAGPLRHTAN